jgi:hypothetical protein
MLSALAQTFGQAYSYTTTSSSTSMSSTFWVVYFTILAAFVLVISVSIWKVFAKAGKPGWAAIVPVYNTIVLLQIVRRPLWWFLLFVIPFVNIVVGIVVYYDLVKAFGRGVGTLLLILLLPIIGLPMLAFGDAKYTAPADR